MRLACLSRARYILIRGAIGFLMLSRFTAQYTLPDDCLVLFEPILGIKVENHFKVLLSATVLQLL